QTDDAGSIPVIRSENALGTGRSSYPPSTEPRTSPVTTPPPAARRPYVVDPEVAAVIGEAAAGVREVSDSRIGDMVEQALLRTLRETITLGEDGSAFVITGDI